MPAQWYPPQTYPVIVQGATWHWEFPFLNSATLQPFDWLEDPSRWTLKADLRDRKGQLLARFRESGTRDGTLSGGSDGVVSSDMTAEETADLPLTRTYVNTTDPRVAAWRNRGNHFLDLTVTDNVTDELWVLISALVTVQKLITP